MPAETTNLKKTTPTRSEVPVETTWDLSVVYASETDWDADFARVEKQLEAFADKPGTLNSAAALLKILQARDEVSQLFEQLYSYASLRRSEDNANAQSQARMERVRMLATRLSAALSFIEPEILALPPEKIAEFLREEPALSLYEYFLSRLEKQRAHIRSDDVEEVLALSHEATGSTSTIYKMFGDADMKFPDVRDENWQETELTHGRYVKFLESQNRRVREDAFRTMHSEYSRWKNTLAASLSGAVKSDVFYARARRYDSALDAALSPDEIPTSVYTNLIAAVRERLPVLHRYLRLRKKMLHFDELQMWDLYVPMVKSVEKTMPYPEACDEVSQSLQPLGEEYARVLAGAFSDRWVDVMENEGKTSGAFSDGAYTTPPYILMNWQDNLSNTFTLAHELGHSLHSHFSREKQPYVYAGYTIFVAEVASTLNEALLTHHLQKQAQADGDRALQLFLLNSYAERFRTTLYRQTMFAEFELWLHQTVESGGALTAETMSEKYLQLNRDFYGAEVNVDPCVAIEWARIPHFYYGFYVYQYATGISAAAALAKGIIEEGDAAVERYLNFLRGGGSATSIQLLQGAGVDMTTPAPVHQALDVFDDLIAQMEKLAE